MTFDVETIRAIGELGAVPLLGFILWQSIRIRKNGDIAALKEDIKTINKHVFELVRSVALIKGHLNIKEEE